MEEGTGGVRPQSWIIHYRSVDSASHLEEDEEEEEDGCEGVLQCPKSSVVTWEAKGALVTQ